MSPYMRPGAPVGVLGDDTSGVQQTHLRSFLVTPSCRKCPARFQPSYIRSQWKAPTKIPLTPAVIFKLAPDVSIPADRL